MNNLEPVVRKRGNYLLDVSCINVASFLQFASLTHRLWGKASKGELAFRGQSNSRWGLISSAIRGVEVDNRVPSSFDFGKQCISEFDSVSAFVDFANGAGITLPESATDFIRTKDASRIWGKNWIHNWPNEDVWDLIALAQHHGMHTRLLDFTSEPLTAAFFAAKSIWDSFMTSPPSSRMYLCVWALDLRFTRAIGSITRRYEEPIYEVHVPRGANEYLKAQDGFFLINRGMNDLLMTEGKIGLERTFRERYDFWIRGTRLKSNNIDIGWMTRQ